MYFCDENEKSIRHLSFADFRDRSYAFAAALNDLGYNNTNQREDEEDQEENDEEEWDEEEYE